MLAACQRAAAAAGAGLLDALPAAAATTAWAQGGKWRCGAASHGRRATLPPVAAPSRRRALSAAAGGEENEGQRWLMGLVNHEATGMPRQVTKSASGGKPGSSSGSSSSSSSSAGAAAGAAPPAGRFDLSLMRALLAGLGDPQARVPIVHIAGTKGKGSVAAMVAAMLRAAGLSVGVYTSPHLHTVRERIQTPAGGAPAADCAAAAPAAAAAAPPIISDADFEALARATRDAAAAALPPGAAPSQFEAVTAMALAHFAAAGADVAVVETGMGGATDATNVAPAASLAAAVLTPIGWDHVDALGGSLESIAAAKAGIMRPGRPAVVAAQPHAAAAAVLADAARSLGAAAVDAGAEVRVTPAGPLRVDPGPGWHLARQAVDVDAPGAGLRLAGVEMRLVGGHQRANAATAVATALQLREQGRSVPDAAIAAGLAAAALAGRFQVVRVTRQQQQQEQQEQDGAEARQPYVVLDGAHTPESAAALAAVLREAFPPPAPLVLVVAMASDKQHRETVAALRAARPGAVVFTAVPVAGGSARSTAPATLVAHWQAAAMLSAGAPFRCRELIQGGMTSALPRAMVEAAGLARAAGGGHPGVVCVTGSLHAVAAADCELAAMMGRV